MKTRQYGSGARGAALEALCRMETEASYSGQTLDGIMERRNLSPEDRSLATRLTYGTVQQRVFLDYQLTALSGKNLAKMDVPVRNILRLGAYQRYFCEKIPASAAVNESVKAVKICGFTSAAGLVNAVLRKIDPSTSLYPEDEMEKRAVMYSLPLWMVYHLRKNYREEPLDDLLRGLSDIPSAFLRVNRCKTTPAMLVQRLSEEGITAVSTALPYALKAEKLPSLRQNVSFQKGLFHVQDLASQLCAAALSAKPGQRVLDLCAAPGGKTFTVCEDMDDRGEIIACDIHPARVSLIEAGAKRLGFTSIHPMTADATVYRPELGAFDRVLCDVPCSGLGVIRRKPEIRFKGEGEKAKYPALQRTILQNASRYVKKGGRLIYSTCTLNHEENEKTVAAFLQDNPAFISVPLFADSSLTMRTFFPHKDGTDGFFAAAVMRKEESHE